MPSTQMTFDGVRSLRKAIAPAITAGLCLAGTLSIAALAQNTPPKGTFRPSGNNGFGNGYQVAPGNSGPNNNANNATPPRTNPSNSPNRNNVGTTATGLKAK